MCQLTLINFKTPILNNLFLLISAPINAETSPGNRDGFGFFTVEKGVFKTKLSASYISNFGVFSKPVLSSKNPIIYHVRKSTLFNNKKENNDSGAHPYDYGNFVLAHNGVLEPKPHLVQESEKFETDSLFFLHILNKEYEKHKDKSFVEIFKSTIEQFYGKFAFLIYHKAENNFYVIRGKTATLYSAKYLGSLIINTEKSSLKDSITSFKNVIDVLEITGKIEKLGSTDFDFENGVKEVEESSIFVLDKDKNELIKLDSVEETKREVLKPEVIGRGFNRQHNESKIVGLDYSCSVMINFMDTFMVDFLYVDKIFFLLFGKSFLTSSEREIENFADILSNIIEKKNKRKLVGIWEKIDRIVYAPNDCPDIEFPYMFDTINNLKRVLREITSVKSD